MRSLISVHLVFIPRVIWSLSAGHLTTVLAAHQLNSLWGKDCNKETKREDWAGKPVLHFVAIPERKGLYSNTLDILLISAPWYKFLVTISTSTYRWKLAEVSIVFCFCFFPRETHTHTHTNTHSEADARYYFRSIILKTLCNDYACISQLIKIVTII